MYVLKHCIKILVVILQELEADADQCAVCIEPYKISDVIRVLPCK